MAATVFAGHAYRSIASSELRQRRHSGTFLHLRHAGAGKIESVWNSWSAGARAATMIFHLTRAE